MGIKRTDASATAISVGMSSMPEVIAPVITTMEGSAHTSPVSASVSPSDSPLPRASPAYPIKAAVSE